MKKTFKIILLVFLIIALLGFVTVVLAFTLCPTPKFSPQKLEKQQAEICFYDRFLQPVFLGTPKNYGGNVKIDAINDYTVNAFIAVEDKRFYTHNGIDFIGVLRSLKNNLFARSLKQGGSTISQQLIKNTHLNPQKTLTRKIAEIKLTLKLEKNYTKKQILQYYLNSIYFGEGCYGLQSASLNYFGKTADKLTLGESACLAGCVKAPSVYNPLKKQCETRRNTVLKLMYEQGFICENEYKKAVNEKVETAGTNDFSNYFSLALDEALLNADITPYFSGKMNIYTNFDNKAQEILESELNEISTDKKAVIYTNDGKILAVVLPKGDFERMPASTIKPLLCYAPAFESGKISLSTKILDEKCDFGDYTPSNYGDKYNGWIDVESAISKSLNVPAIKILQTVGAKNAKKYLQKMGIDIKENGLNIALGAYNGGVSIIDLCTAYSPFLNGGNFVKTHFVNTVEVNGKKIFKAQNDSEKIFREGTCDLINQALKSCAKNGTAKALCDLPFEVCAKTGTNGSSKGNTDAYTVCYTSSHLLGVWLGNADNSVMPNDITGGYTSRIANNILKNFYADNYPADFTLSTDVTKVKLCKLAYEQNKILLKDKNAPDRFCFEGLFLKGFEPTCFSEEYSNPKLLKCDLSVDKKGVLIEIEKNQHVYFEIIRRDEKGKTTLFESCDCQFKDENLPCGKYCYFVTPFVKAVNGEKIYGEKICLPQVKIAQNSSFENFEWWKD